MERTPTLRAAILLAAWCVLALNECQADDKVSAFATPSDAISAYRKAYAKRDWRACFMCLTPSTRGAVLYEICFLHRIKHREITMVVDRYTTDLEAIVKASVKPVDGMDELDDTLLFESFQRHVKDVPGLVVECSAHYRLFTDPGPATQIKIAGARATGSLPPFPQSKPPVAPIPLKDRQRFIEFKRIGDSWLIDRVRGL